MSALHQRYMQVALRLARRQAGQTHPNPNVGAIIVKNGQIIAQGVTAKDGRPHAETIAIENSGSLTQGATLYVTLEPCSHHGKTPPCVDAIIAAGIKTVVIACRDKNPQVCGSGIAALKKAGIEVIENICEKEGLEINQGFFSVIEKNRSYIALKIATSLDGKIAYSLTCHPALVAVTPPNGGAGAKPTDIACNSRPRNKCGVTEEKIKWLTGETARNYGHLLRSQYDAILTGSGTVITDDPLLTCRLVGFEHRSPVRIVLDRNGKTPKNAKIFTEQNISPTLVINEPTIAEAINKITEQGITSILVEAGAKLTTAFLESGLVDKVYWFRAPITIGEEGLSVTAALEQLANFKQIEHIELGIDTLDIFKCSQEL